MSELHGRQRLDDVPAILRWVIVFIKEVGFPVAVAVYMGYLTITQMPKMSNALEANTRAMVSLADEVQHDSKRSEKIFRKLLGNRYPDE